MERSRYPDGAREEAGRADDARGEAAGADDAGVPAD
jgi:hypothetical protein